MSLEAESVDSVVLAYSGTSQESTERLQEIQQLWQVLESNVQDAKLSRIGISDVDTDLFIALYNSAKVGNLTRSFWYSTSFELEMISEIYEHQFNLK